MAEGPTRSTVSLSKKILVVSSVAPHRIGGPVNLYSFLAQLSKDSYCVLTTYESIRGHATNPRLSAEHFFCDHPGPVEDQTISPTTVPTSSVSTSKLRSFAKRIPGLVSCYREMRSMKRFLLTLIRMIRVGTHVCREKQIQYVLGFSDSGPALIASRFISLLTGIPYGLYLFDIYLGNYLRPIETLFAKIFEPTLFRTASVVILTNEGTEQYYRKRYGDAFRCVVIHNSVFPEPYESSRTIYGPSPPYTILYTGGVYWAQERSLINLIHALDEIRDLPIRLELYIPYLTETLRQEIQSRSNIILRAARQSEMAQVQCAATILFLPLSWHTKGPDVIATATPGKLTDYLASGRPILIHAPPYAWLNQYARENEFALVVDEESKERLKDAIRKLVSDLDFSNQLIRNALKTFYANHNAETNLQKFISIFNSS
jgi:glycosyltransferase involved in cell wall biosynthesis